jgi:hypothetical protein
MTVPFNRDSEAMNICYYLNQIKPLPPNLYYRVYKDSKCTPVSNISIIELTSTFKDLNI